MSPIRPPSSESSLGQHRKFVVRSFAALDTTSHAIHTAAGQPVSSRLRGQTIALMLLAGTPRPALPRPGEPHGTMCIGMHSAR